MSEIEPEPWAQADGDLFDDGEEVLGLQAAILSESTLKRLWDSREEDDAWRDL